MQLSLKSGALWGLTVTFSVASSLALATVWSGAEAEPFDPLDVTAQMEPATSPIADPNLHVLFDSAPAARIPAATLPASAQWH